jgi:hypothetical protein
MTNAFGFPNYFLLPSHNSEKYQWFNRLIFA